MPPAPKEARVDALQTSPHRLAHHHHLTRLPTQAPRHVLAATHAEAERRAEFHPAIASEVRRDPTGTRIGISVSSEGTPTVWCLAGSRILLHSPQRTGQLYVEINVADFHGGAPELLEAWTVADGRGLAVLNRASGQLALLLDAFAAPRNVVRSGLTMTAADESVVAVDVAGEFAVALTSRQNVFVVTPADLKAGGPISPFPCCPGRSLWRLPGLFGKGAAPISLAAWSPTDQSVVLARGRTLEKWRDGVKVMDIVMDPGTEVKALHIQSQDEIHVLYVTASPVVPETVAEDDEGHRYAVARYRDAALLATVPLKYRYPLASRCFLDCPEAPAGAKHPPCATVALDNLLVVTGEGGEDVLVDDFFTFAYCREPWGLWMARLSGLWRLKALQTTEAEEAVPLGDVAALPTGVTARNAVEHSKRIADGSLAGPATWAQFAKATDDESAGLVMVKAMARKRGAHRAFITSLRASHLWDEMSQADRRAVHEHGEKLAACHAMRRLQNDQCAAKSKSRYFQGTQAFLQSLIADAVAEVGTDDPNAQQMSAQEKFFSQATQAHRFFDRVAALRDHPQRWAAALEANGLPAYVAVSFLGQVLQEMFRAVLGHRDAFAQQGEDRGSLEWTRKDDFMRVIHNQLAMADAVLVDLAKGHVTTSDGLLLATELMERHVPTADPTALDPAGELLKLQAHLLDYALEFTADHGKAAPDATALVRKYLVDYALPATRGEGARRATAKLTGREAVEPARWLAEKWHLFPLLIQLARKDPSGPPDPELIQAYLRRFSANGFATVLFDSYRERNEWRALLEVPGVEHDLAPYLEAHNSAAAAVHRLRYAVTCEGPEGARQLHASAALFQDAAHQEADLRTRKATLSLAKLVLHLKTLQAPPLEMDHRHVTEVNNELQVLKLQEEFLEGVTAYIPPATAIERLCAAATQRPDRKGRLDRLEAALQLNRRRVDCSDQERTERAKYIWGQAFKAEEHDWRTLSGSSRDGASDTEVRGYIEDSLLCRLREGAEGASLTPEVFTALHREGAFGRTDERLLEGLRDCLFLRPRGALTTGAPPAVAMEPIHVM